MSVTVTQNPVTYTIASTLADYNLQHTEPPTDSSRPVAEPNPRGPAPFSASNPQGWESEYRNVPAYRPVDHTLDFESRNTALNNVEAFFLFNMFHGIQIVQYMNRAWRATGGKINSSYFRFPVGGEY